jgi:CubicO group peptidase (beta-lactamase class C family)
MQRWLAVGAVAATLGLATPMAGAAPMKHCALPAPGGSFATASPGEEALDAPAVQQAITYATTHARDSVQIFRNGCRVAAGLLDPLTDGQPHNVFSSTKSVISMLTGIALAQHKLALDDRIGRYLPKAAGWGDGAHRAITIRQLLTETSGLQEAILSESATVGTDPNVAQEALAQPITHQPGTHFEYSQRDPDLLAYIVQRAVGTDLQAYAQHYLLGPIGIPRNSYYWLRDRSSNSYGYAFLYLPPTQFAKLALLLVNHGVWNRRHVLSNRYIHQLARPTATNPCYGLLFWTNAAKPCTSANIPAAQTVNRTLIPSAPRDLYAMIGAFQQNNFVIPSLHIAVTWTGNGGDMAPNLAGVISAQPAADLYYNFFRILMRGVRDRHIHDPGPYPTPSLDLDVNPLNYADPSVLLHDLDANPDCNILVCDGTVPTEGAAENQQAITATVIGDGPRR